MRRWVCVALVVALVAAGSACNRDSAEPDLPWPDWVADVSVEWATFYEDPASPLLIDLALEPNEGGLERISLLGPRPWDGRVDTVLAETDQGLFRIEMDDTGMPRTFHAPDGSMAELISWDNSTVTVTVRDSSGQTDTRTGPIIDPPPSLRAPATAGIGHLPTVFQQTPTTWPLVDLQETPAVAISWSQVPVTLGVTSPAEPDPTTLPLENELVITNATCSSNTEGVECWAPTDGANVHVSSLVRLKPGTDHPVHVYRTEQHKKDAAWFEDLVTLGAGSAATIWLTCAGLLVEGAAATLLGLLSVPIGILLYYLHQGAVEQIASVPTVADVRETVLDEMTKRDCRVTVAATGMLSSDTYQLDQAEAAASFDPFSIRNRSDPGTDLAHPEMIPVADTALAFTATRITSTTTTPSTTSTTTTTTEPDQPRIVAAFQGKFAHEAGDFPYYFEKELRNDINIFVWSNRALEAEYTYAWRYPYGETETPAGPTKCILNITASGLIQGFLPEQSDTLVHQHKMAMEWSNIICDNGYSQPTTRHAEMSFTLDLTADGDTYTAASGEITSEEGTPFLSFTATPTEIPSTDQ